MERYLTWEPMVVTAMVIVIYFGYLTVKDSIVDLRQEGILPTAPAPKKPRELSTARILVYCSRLKYSRPRIDARRPAWLVDQGPSLSEASRNACLGKITV